MNALTPLQIARRAFAAYLLADKEGLRIWSHPDSTWTFPGDPRVLPWTGTYRGAEIARFLDTLIDHLDYQEVRVAWWIEAGERVFVQATERFVVRANGQVCDNRYVGVVTVRDGKVWRYDEFGDTAAIERAFSP